ncbi:membrane protein [Zafaria cholistanensis]|uniref:Membrane protein n=1 Tax=Zafaria cholistanensis TaxID=1682741 RepID=A0A5A7NPH0_9MICC|nr:DUF202 domain-containing protein [Zafaria cholistanensis]GER22793.1 membrane protein [Zafaria cholistanensis]
MGGSEPALRLHEDPGLQPERTVMAWGRTMLSLFVASAVFLRWLPHYGPAVVLLMLLSGLAAAGIYASQQRRYRNGSEGIRAGRVEADIVAVVSTGASVAVLGVLALWILAAKVLS